MPKREKRMRAVRPGRAQRQTYLTQLDRMVDLLKGATANLSDVVNAGADRVTVARSLTELAASTQATIDGLAPGVARSFVSDTDRAQKAQMQRNMSDALGVDFVRVLDNPQVAADLQLAQAKNAALIKSIGAQHWSDVSQAVLDNYAGRELPEDQTLTQRLKQLGGITDRRAAIIARDQTNKLTGALNQSRMEANGISEYIWRTAGDRRVVGTPGGLYPKGSRAHENHYERNGKRFKWSEPPADGHPGEAILCRCIAVPVFDPVALAAKYA